MCCITKFFQSMSGVSGDQYTSFFGTLLLTLMFSGCASNSLDDFTDEAVITSDNVNKLQIVDCLLPGQIRQLGQSFTYVTTRRPVRTTAADCELRGGEYVAFDRANYATALKTWQPKANEGDAEAQFYVGEIYEKGLGIAPDYDLAVLWYNKAAEQGYSSAMVNLGYLYEKGFGVPQDSVAALNWYRKAAGLENTEVAFSASVEQTNAQMESLRQESAQYQQQSEQYQQETAQLRQKLGNTNQQLKSTQQQLKSQKQKAVRERQSLQRMRKQLQDKKQTSSSDQTASQSSRAELVRYETEIKQKQAELLQQQQMIRKLENVAKKHKQTLNSLKQDSERFALEQTSAQMESLRQESAKYQQQSEQYQQQLKQQKQNALRERQSVERMRKQLQEKKQAIPSGQISSQESSAEIARYEKEIKRKETELLKQQQMIGQLENEATQQKQTLSILKEGAERFAEETSVELSALRTKLSSSNVRSELLGDELQQSHEQLDQLHLIITQQSARLSNREADLKALREKLKNKKKHAKTPKENVELEKLSQTLTEREQELQAQRDEMAELNDRWETLSRQDQIKQQELKAQSDKITTLQARIDREKEEAELAKSAASKLAKMTAPRIEIIDPPLTNQRGTRSVSARSGVKSRTIIGKVQAPGGLVSLIINDAEETVDNNGFFKVKIPLTSTSTLIQIAAIDKNSKRSELRFTIDKKVPETTVAKTTAVSTSEQPQAEVAKLLPRNLFGNYHALLIGNNTYQKLPHLDTAINDAKGISDVLQKQYGFKTRVLLNATRYDILKVLNEYRKTLTEKDNLLIFYAGHGILDKVNDRGHWLPVDAEPDSTANWISVENVTDQLKIIAAKHVLVIADSCYSGALTRSSIARLEAGMTPEKRAQWIKLMLNAKSRVALSSGGLEPVLDGGGGNHSIFAKALIDTLSKNKDLMESQALYRNVSALVADAASDQDFNQVPEYSPIRHAGHAAGEFFFYPAF